MTDETEQSTGHQTPSLSPIYNTSTPISLSRGSLMPMNSSTGRDKKATILITTPSEPTPVDTASMR
ncbi:hypothetical protein GBAR_LOCUS20845 [Geodia barretti]|uniref:Uncharacterized protein n=1 Tax=Geodia barretti TaxID=519541 RepID=A0AA35SXA8_GEOBA|nr:hypothetical protein GBAR_LOCUS20845 [Geodia barretti]